jgi:hypothetical protein
MFAQFLIDNTRRFSSKFDIAVDNIAAELLHSALFHDKLLYVDDYIVNNPYLSNALLRYETIHNIFQSDYSYIGLSDISNCLYDKILYLQSVNIYHPHFRSLDNFVNTQKIFESQHNSINTIKYNACDFRSKFTEEVFAVFKSELSKKILGDKYIEVYDIIKAISEEKASATGDTTLRQSDFEHANREYASLDVRLKDIDLEEDPKQFKNKIYELERFCYRNARASILDNSIIMPPEHSQIFKRNFDVVHQIYDNIYYNSEWFFAWNLLQLTTNDINILRSSEEFLEYRDAVNSIHKLNLDHALQKVSSLYISRIEALIKERIPSDKRKQLKRKIILITPLLSIANTLSSIESRLSENLSDKNIGNANIAIAIYSNLGDQGVGDSLNILLQNIAAIPIELTRMATFSDIKATNLLNMLENALGRKICADSKLPDQYTAYS